MLAQNFKTPEVLGINEEEFVTFVRLLAMFEREEIPPNRFDMTNWDQTKECGTAHCIGGWARQIGGQHLFRAKRSKGLYQLFYPGMGHVADRAYHSTPAEAALALRSYLTTGKPCWREAVAC